MENLRKNHAQAIVACDLDPSEENHRLDKNELLQQHVYCFERQAASLAVEP
jgi:hypothetical protein